MQHTLYHEEVGYFAQQAAPVGMLPEPIAFNNLRNEADYRSKIRSLYDHLQVCKPCAFLSAPVSQFFLWPFRTAQGG